MTEIDTEAFRYVSHLTEYHVLICHSRKHCISPNGDGIVRHFMEKHITSPIQTCQSIITYCNSLELTNPTDVKIPSTDIERIAELELEFGWRCQGQLNGEECRYCCIKENSMKNHCREAHGWIKSKGSMWKRQGV